MTRAIFVIILVFMVFMIWKRVARHPEKGRDGTTGQNRRSGKVIATTSSKKAKLRARAGHSDNLAFNNPYFQRSQATKLPRKGMKSYRKVRKTWKREVQKVGFSLSEMPYSRAQAQAFYNNKGKMVSRQVVWNHMLANCRVRINFDARWNPKKSGSYCGRR